MTDETTPESEQQPAAQANVESLRVTVDVDGNVVPEGDPAGARILTGRDAADAMKKQQQASAQEQPKEDKPEGQGEALSAEPTPPLGKAESQSETKARKAPPEDK